MWSKVVGSKSDRQGDIELQLSEGFIQADDEILQTIINMTILENNPQDKQLIRHFSSTEGSAVFSI